MNAIQKLRDLVKEIRTSKQPAQVHAAWELVIRLLGRMPVDAATLDAILKTRDVNGLDALVTQMEKPPAPRVAPVQQQTVDMKRDMEIALRAFRKRLKLARLNDESKLGGRQMTSGRQSQIDAIIPPLEFGKEVWTALAQAGQLKDAGGGFYELPPGAQP